MRRALRLRLVWCSLSCALLLAGCNALLGIEDLSSESGDASAGGAGKDGTSGSGRADGGPRGSGSGGAGTQRDGSTAGGNGGNGGGEPERDGAVIDGASGSEADSGTPDSGTPDSGGVPAIPTVHGKVIDYYRNPVPAVAVRIGDATTMTDASGEFTIDDVSATYDTSLTLTVPSYGRTEVAGWLFVGLTRRDPTFQVYRGHPRRSGDVSATIDNVTFPMPDYDQIEVGFTGMYGESNLGLDSAATNTSLGWEGPAMISGTAHALRWSNAVAAPHSPTAYLAQDVHPLGLAETTAASLALDLGSPAGGLPSALVSGTVTAPTSNERTNTVFLRYSDDAVIQLVNQYTAPDTYSYLVPSLQGTSIVVAATMNTYSSTPFAVAYADGVTPGTTDIALKVPSPATPLTPGEGTSNVTGDTKFTWLGSDQVYMVVFGTFPEQYYVITTAKEAHIPAPPLTNLPLAANSQYLWTVRTHDTYASVDDATGPDGFLDAYCYGEISGPRRGNGTHTVSAELGFTTAP